MMRLSIISTLSETIRRRASAVVYFSQDVSICSAEGISPNPFFFIKCMYQASQENISNFIIALEKEEEITNLRDSGAAEE